MSYYCGVDIGGTFTDCVLVDETGTITLAKASSTPQDFSQGFLDAIEEAARQRGIDPEGVFGEIELLLHGTTVGTNVLVQMRGAKTGLITTRGHRDALVMMRSYGRSAGLPIEKLLHVSRHRKPDPIVPPQLIKEVSERVDWAGDVFLPLNEDEARAAVEELVAEEVDAIAISFLWGFVNPDHERRVKALVQELAPDVFVSCAHELIAKPGEYERTAAAAINCYVGPSTSTYVQRLDGATRERGYTHPLLIMQAAGGVVPANEVAEAPLFTIGSGPVGGVTGATFLADVLGHKNVIACDMGGTSFDVGLVHDGLPISSSETVINQYTFFMPRLLIESIGAGGGSIVWVDEQSGTIRVGPESAGADPGPACYGRGGERPTITDVNVLLGRYNPENFLGGRLALDREAAERAMASVAEALGMDVVEAAAGAARIVEYQMADLMRQMTVEQGLDPREFVVYAYGGAGAAHAAVFARELGCTEVVVPLGDLASTWSALGVMSSDVLHVYEHAELVDVAVRRRPDRRDLRGARGARAHPARRRGVRRRRRRHLALRGHEVLAPDPPGRGARPRRGADRGDDGAADRDVHRAVRVHLREGLGVHRRRRPDRGLPGRRARADPHAGAAQARGRRRRRRPRARGRSTGRATASSRPTSGTAPRSGRAPRSPVRRSSR